MLFRSIITECGLHTRKITSKTKAGFTVGNDATTAGLLDFVFKAATGGVGASYETQQSTDNIAWATVKTSPDSSSTYAHGAVSGTKLYHRGRVILSEKKGGAQAWITPPVPYIFVL